MRLRKTQLLSLFCVLLQVHSVSHARENVHQYVTTVAVRRSATKHVLPALNRANGPASITGKAVLCRAEPHVRGRYLELGTIDSTAEVRLLLDLLYLPYSVS